MGLEDSGGERDELFEEALRICVEMKRASTSVLQRRLRIATAGPPPCSIKWNVKADWTGRRRPPAPSACPRQRVSRGLGRAGSAVRNPNNGSATTDARKSLTCRKALYESHGRYRRDA